MTSNLNSNSARESYESLMKTTFTTSSGGKDITVEDLQKCTGHWGGAKGKIIRVFNRLQRIEKGYIDEKTITKFAGTLFAMENRQKLENTSKQMVKLAEELKKLFHEELSASHWDPERRGAHLKESKELEK